MFCHDQRGFPEHHLVSLGDDIIAFQAGVRRERVVHHWNIGIHSLNWLAPKPAHEKRLGWGGVKGLVLACPDKSEQQKTWWNLGTCEQRRDVLLVNVYTGLYWGFPFSPL